MPICIVQARQGRRCSGKSSVEPCPTQLRLRLRDQHNYWDVPGSSSGFLTYGARGREIGYGGLSLLPSSCRTCRSRNAETCVHQRSGETSTDHQLSASATLAPVRIPGKAATEYVVRAVVSRLDSHEITSLVHLETTRLILR